MTAADPRDRALRDAFRGVAKARAFTGWSFRSRKLGGRRLGPPLPWRYEMRGRRAARNARAVLDLGTGGGERFERILRDRSGFAAATEEWRVNVPVAARRLGAVGVSVVAASSLALPFRDASFDLVLSRHEEISPAEVGRVLAPGGLFLTQQVGPDTWPELAAAFPRWTVFPDHFTDYRRGLVEAGLEIRAAIDDASAVAYGGLDAISFHLAVAPWFLPDFDPERDLDALLALAAEHGGPDGIVLTETHYLIEAVKPL